MIETAYGMPPLIRVTIMTVPIIYAFLTRFPPVLIRSRWHSTDVSSAISVLLEISFNMNLEYYNNADEKYLIPIMSVKRHN